MRSSTENGSNSLRPNAGPLGSGALGCLVATLALLLAGCPPKTGLANNCPDGQVCEQAPTQPDPDEGTVEPGQGNPIPIWKLLLGSGDEPDAGTPKEGDDGEGQANKKKEPGFRWLKREEQENVNRERHGGY